MIAGVDEEESLQIQEPPDEDDLYHLVNEEDGPEIIDLTLDDEYYETQDRLKQTSEPIDQQHIIVKEEPIEQPQQFKEEEGSNPLRELQETEAAMDAELDASMREFREVANERPAREIKPVERLQPSTVPGELSKGQTYAEVTASGAVNSKAVYGKKE